MYQINRSLVSYTLITGNNAQKSNISILEYHTYRRKWN
jgi:hypothetical protein